MTSRVVGNSAVETKPSAVSTSTPICLKDDHRLAFGLTDALLLLMASLWGINYSVIKYASPLFSPLTFVWLRVACAVLSLLGAAFLRRTPWPSWRILAALLGLGILGNGVHQLLFVNGVVRARVADAALIAASVPAVVAALGWLQDREPVRMRALVGIVLSIVGVGVVILGSTHVPHRTGSVVGVTLVVGAVFCWSVATVAIKAYTPQVDVVQLGAVMMVGGMLPLLLVTPMIVHTTAWRNIPLLGWGAVLYSGVLSVGVGYLLWYRGIRVLGPMRAAMYGNLQPVVATLVAWAALQEVPTVWQGTGAVVIIGGVLLTRL